MSSEIERAASLLRAGGLVAFPTETVYGLGADADNPAGSFPSAFFAAKGRPADHPVIVHIVGGGAWALVAGRGRRRGASASGSGPGRSRWWCRARAVPRRGYSAGQETVGLRVPDHPLALALLRAFGGGIAAPSANRFGRLSPTPRLHVRGIVGGAVSMVLDGGALPGRHRINHRGS